MDMHTFLRFKLILDFYFIFIYLYQDTKIIRFFSGARKINDPCMINIQCTSSFGTHSECRQNKLGEMGHCGCAKNAHFQDGLCYLSVRKYLRVDCVLTAIF